MVILVAFVLCGCGEEGEAGTTAMDCGDHGTAHGDHCHCDHGFLFDAETCVAPEQITEVCGEHPEGATDAGEEEHHHGACLCPDQGECPCDSGTVEELGGKKYCVPELHRE